MTCRAPTACSCSTMRWAWCQHLGARPHEPGSTQVTLLPPFSFGRKHRGVQGGLHRPPPPPAIPLFRARFCLHEHSHAL
eukprot:321617-Chlamydomonas_euryale.AAC.1